MLVEELVAEHVGVEVAVGVDVDDVEDLHHADRDGDEDRDERALDLRDDDAEEDLALVAPSMRAASRVSTGTPLTAAESSTIEKPTWAQSRITISSRLLRWKPLCCSQATGPPVEDPEHGVLDPDLRLALRLGVVDEPPDRRGADQADRHRQEDDRSWRSSRRCGLSRSASTATSSPIDHRDGRHDDDPQQGVEQRLLELVRLVERRRSWRSRPSCARGCP